MLVLLSAYTGYLTFTFLSVLLLTVAVIPTLQIFLTIFKTYLTARDIPGPKGYPLIGNVFEMMEPATLFNHINDCFLEFGQIFKLWVFHKLCIIMTDPDEVKFVLTKLKENHRPGYLVAPVKEFFGNGLLSLRDGAVYRAHKKVISPMFYPGMLNNYHSVFNEKLTKLTERLSEQADGRTIDIFPYFTSYAVETSCSTMIGCDYTSMEKSINEYTEAVVDALESMPIVAFQPWLRVPGFQMLFPSGRKIAATQKTLKSFIERIVNERLQSVGEARDLPVNNVVEGDDVYKKREAFSMLDLVFKGSESGGYKLTKDEMKAELQNVTAAGFHTISATLSFMCLLLGMHEQIQEDVAGELEKVFGSSSRAATTEDLSRLEVLDRILKETLRLLPGAQLIGREVTEDIQLPSGKVLPEGSSIIVSVYHLQRDPNSFRDPEKFIPDRWLPENSSQVNPDAYAPFGSVARTCVGYRYAMLQMKVVASHLLRQFRVTTDYTMEDLKKQGMSVVTVFYGGYRVQLHKRKMAKNNGKVLRNGGTLSYGS